jgi:3-oxoadipate enol-lactonase
MDIHQLDTGNGLFHLHTVPQRPKAPTFVFVNALTGLTDHWEQAIAPALRAQGFGTLSYNFRG